MSTSKPELPRRLLKKASRKGAKLDKPLSSFVSWRLCARTPMVFQQAARFERLRSKLGGFLIAPHSLAKQRTNRLETLKNRQHIIEIPYFQKPLGIPIP